MMTKAGSLLILASLALVGGGCTTAALWDEGRFARFHEASDPPALRLYRGEDQKLLVQYNESVESNDSIHRRAYWLEDNRGRLEERLKPHFVPLARSKNLTLVPVIESPGVPDQASIEDWHAVVSTNGHTFVLYAANKEVGTYELPVYCDASGRVKQVLLTPFAVAVDLTIIGAVLSYLWLPAVADSH
jgi:hypothetical protein